jgi:hypothetical protein
VVSGSLWLCLEWVRKDNNIVLTNSLPYPHLSIHP